MIGAICDNQQSTKQPTICPYSNIGRMHHYQHLSMLDKHFLKKQFVEKN
jgi:hypothetical protein